MNLDQRLLHQARASQLFLILTIGLSFFGGIFTVAQAYFLSKIITQVFLDGQGVNDVISLLIALLGVILLRSGLVWGSDVTANYLAIRVKTGLRDRLVRHLFDLGPTYARDERTGELTTTVIEGIEALEAYFSQYLPQLALAALVPLTILFTIFPLDVLSAVVLLVTAPLIPLFMILIGRFAETLSKRQYQLLSRLSAHFLDVLQGLTTLKIFGRSRDQAKIIAQISDRYAQTTLDVLRVAFLSALVLEMVATLSTAVIAVEVGLRLLYARIAFQEALFILILAPEFYLPLRMLGTRFHAGMEGVSAAQRIFQILETPVTVSNTPSPLQSVWQPDASNAQSSIGEILFENVHYAYTQARQPALNGVSFRIKEGRRVALVGASGAGKSTLAQLLLRFIEPDQGIISILGTPLQEIPTDEWRERVAWVPQLPYLFHATVAANIRLGRPNASPEEVAWAAQQAQLSDFIQTLPESYNTIIGERGLNISSGQAQRIALARAFLKDAPILILDEPTSNLDPATEELLNEGIARLLRSRTAIIITHRLSTAYRADQVVVLDRGRVSEQGTHTALIQRGGLYQQLVTAHGAKH